MIQQSHFCIYIQWNEITLEEITALPCSFAALVTIAKIWKLSKYPSTDEVIKNIWYIHKMGYYSATKNEGNSSIGDNMSRP